ncbi:G protein-coupled receptor GPR1 [Meyerozyma sp. JA9]|nr:G protein-coupled receptor GPR1 [Meyerozyma sp. JA9]
MRNLHALLHARSADITQDVRRYTEHEALVTRTLSIVASSLSLVSGLVALYFFRRLSRHKKLIFRHQLILFLVCYDFIKALFLLMYPARVIAKSSVYYDVPFCKVVGFFTAMSIEGSDLAILSFAVHVALLIYRPNVKVNSGSAIEGGLYPYRNYVYILSILLPILLAALAFASPVSYTPLTNWCYLSTEAVWCRLALSWVPRYVIIVAIFVIYGCVYRHVTKQYSVVARRLRGGRKGDRFWKRYLKMLTFILFSNVELASDASSDGSVPHKVGSVPHKVGLDDAYTSFKARRSVAERQMKLIFIYPLSYVFLWIAPLVVHAMDFKYGTSRRPIMWITYLAAFMQPFNCTVDTLVFLVREKPWKDDVNIGPELAPPPQKPTLNSQPDHASTSGSEMDFMDFLNS